MQKNLKYCKTKPFAKDIVFFSAFWKIVTFYIVCKFLFEKAIRERLYLRVLNKIIIFLR